jgi:hypothetical protein
MASRLLRKEFGAESEAFSHGHEVYHDLLGSWQLRKFVCQFQE